MRFSRLVQISGTKADCLSAPNAQKQRNSDTAKHRDSDTSRQRHSERARQRNNDTTRQRFTLRQFGVRTRIQKHENVVGTDGEDDEQDHGVEPVEVFHLERATCMRATCMRADEARRGYEYEGGQGLKLAVDMDVGRG